MASYYDVDRFEPPPDPNLVCSICQGVMHDPVETRHCRHTFCRECIETWVRHSRTCPTCRRALALTHLMPVNPIIQNMIHRLNLRCEHAENGCPERLTLEHYETHAAKCDFEMRTCRHRQCGKRLFRREVWTHEMSCEMRELRCPRDCRLYVTVRTLDTHNCMKELRKRHQEEQQRTRELEDKIVALQKNLKEMQERVDQLEEDYHYDSDYWEVDSDPDADNATNDTNDRSTFDPLPPGLDTLFNSSPDSQSEDNISFDLTPRALRLPISVSSSPIADSPQSPDDENRYDDGWSADSSESDSDGDYQSSHYGESNYDDAATFSGGDGEEGTSFGVDNKNGNKSSHSSEEDSEKRISKKRSHIYIGSSDEEEESAPRKRPWKE